MKNKITIVNDDMTISHRVIAEQTANQEVSIRNTILKFIDDFKIFGTVHFKNEGIVNNGKGEQPKTYFLNEQQAYLLLTYLRNSEIVRNFKVALVKAFFEMKKQLENKSSNSDLQKILDKLETQNQEIQNLKNQLSLQNTQKQNPFKGYYENKNRELGQRENEFAYSRYDWMMLVNECETQLSIERGNKKHRTLLIAGGVR